MWLVFDRGDQPRRPTHAAEVNLATGSALNGLMAGKPTSPTHSLVGHPLPIHNSVNHRVQIVFGEIHLRGNCREQVLLLICKLAVRRH